jgi:hypothetical protein
MAVTTRQGEADGRGLSELTVRAALLASLVTFLIMIGLPALWAFAAAY